jgi:hypothetical protein
MSFGFTGVMRQGAWRDFRYFVLHQRRDVLARLATINAELNRIGNIRILYARTNPDDPNSPLSEARVGLDVSPGTSLAKLLMAYCANGGNPFDISLFLVPDAFEFVEAEESGSNGAGEAQLRETQPYGGSAWSGSTDPILGGTYTGGWIPLWRYPPRRFGNTVSYATKAAEVTRDVHATRQWVTQEIRTLRNDLEARILKLCDLREQLKKEANELIPQAVGGVLPGVYYDTEQHAVSHHVSSVVDAIDTVFYPTLSDGTFDFTQPRVTTPNPEYPTLLDDAPAGEEDWTALG